MSYRNRFARVRSMALQGSMLAALGVTGPALLGQVSQSYNAPNPTVASGSVGLVRNSANEQIIVNSQTAVLDWTPTDRTAGSSAINFQNANSSVTYSGFGNFTVLNRIVPIGGAVGRAVQFNGTVNSVVGNTTGGTVWFYSPGGIVLGQGASFNVGNLLLSASDPINGASSIASTTSFQGGGAGEAGIEVNTGAQINALAEGSYVALVAPRVVVDGNIRVNGQTALVGAERATLTINNGLFDIVLASGTDAGGAFPVVVRGSIGGPASTGSTDPHAIYVVTVPKNVATTALIEGTGNIGFDVATNVAIVNGRVVLSNGYNIAAGNVGGLATSPAVGDVHLTGGTYTSSVFVNATQNAYAVAFGSNTPQFNRDLTMSGLVRAHLASRQANTTLTVGGNVLLTSDGTLSTASVNGVPVTTMTGGEVLVYTETGGSLVINGNMRLNSVARASNVTGLTAARGGSAIVSTQGGGSLTVRGTSSINATAEGNAVAGQPGATLTGGTAGIFANSGNMTFTGQVEVYSDALGGSSASTTTRAVATSGSTTVRTAAPGSTGSISFGSSVFLRSGAYGDRSTVANGLSGSAVAGTVNVTVQGNNTLTAPSLSLDAGAFGGNVGFYGVGAVGTDGGDATGGIARLDVGTGATATIGSLSINANGDGGGNRGGGDGIAGSGTGGSAILSSVGTTNITGFATTNAPGTGGIKTEGATGGGGVGTGGEAGFFANDGTITIGSSANVFADGRGGAASTAPGGNGGAGNGGSARFNTGLTGGTLTVTGLATASATGVGGAAANVAGAVGGTGTGGFGNQSNAFQRGAYAVAQSGTIRLNGGGNLNATGQGGVGPVGGAGVAGVTHYVSTGGLLLVGGTATATVNAFGGNAVANTTIGGGAGGSATAGDIVATVEPTNGTAGRVQLGTVVFNAAAQGGTGAAGLANQAGGTGGAAQGGSAIAYARASTQGIATGSIVATVYANGGTGGAGSGTGNGGAGGAATGGQIGFGTTSDPNLPPNTGSAVFGNVVMAADGNGGTGGAGATGGAGGLGTGGGVTLLARGTPVTVGTFTTQASGRGGSGGSGTTQGVAGSGVGGSLAILATNRFQRPERGRLTVGATVATTSGLAGTGASGATTRAGTGFFQVSSGDASFTSLSYTSAGALAAAQTPPLTFDVADGTLAVSGALGINSTGDAVMSVRDGGTLSALQLTANIRGSVSPRATGVAIGTFGAIVTTGSQSWTAGNLALQSNLTAGGAVTVATNNLTVGNVTAGNDIGLSATRVTAGNLASTNGSVFLGTGATGGVSTSIATGSIAAPRGSILSGFVTGTTTTGPLTAGDQIYIEADGGVTVNGDATAGTLAAQSQGALPTAADLYLLSVAGPITAGNLTALYVQVGQGDEGAGGAPVRLGNVNAEAIEITGSGSVTTGNLVVRDVYPRMPLSAEQSPILFAGSIGNLTTGNATGGYFGLLGSRDGSIATGDLNFVGSVAVLAGQNATVGQVTTGRGTGDLFFVADPSVVNDPLLAPYFDSLLDLDIDDSGLPPFNPALLLQVNPVAMGGALGVGNISTGTVRIGSRSATFAAIDASQRIQVTTSALAGFNGLAIAPRLDITSGDIAIGSAGGLGSSATSVLNLTMRSPTVVLGGQGGTGGYVLDNAEAQRLIGTQLNLFADDAVIVRDLSLSGSSSQRPNLVGNNAIFSVSAAGAIRVEGTVALSGAASTDTFYLGSNQRVAVATDANGSITVGGAQAGSLGGVLQLSAPVIAVATSNILSQMATDPRYAGRDAALAITASNRPEGFLQAGSILLRGSNVIAIQNSGTSTTAAGFTSGAGGTTIVNTAQAGAQAVDINIYGRTTLAAGGFAINTATRDTVTRQANNGTFSATAAINGCLFTAATCVVSTGGQSGGGQTGGGQTGGGQSGGNQGTVIPISPAVAALVDRATGGDPVLAASVPAIRIVRMLDDAAIEEDAQVTDPVAGSANASVWDTGTNDDEADGSDAKADAPGAGGGR